jgi:hypothetical protein
MQQQDSNTSNNIILLSQNMFISVLFSSNNDIDRMQGMEQNEKYNTLISLSSMQYPARDTHQLGLKTLVIVTSATLKSISDINIHAVFP